MVDRWENKPAVPALGRLPECVGHYEAGDIECEAPCLWKAGCQIYRLWAESRAESLGIDADDYISGEQESLPRKARAVMIREIMRAQPDTSPRHRPRHLQGWQRFLDTFADSDPGVPVMPSERTARDGELYVKSWHDRSARGPTKYHIRVKGSNPDRCRRDLTIFSYKLGIKSRIQPNIEMRVDIKDLFARFKGLRYAASRWISCAKGNGPRWRERQSKTLGVTAVAVHSERIEDFGRVCAGILAEGIIPGMTVSGRVVVWTEEAARWRL